MSIEEHEWSDVDFSTSIDTTENIIYLDASSNDGYFLEEPDAIAIAKHFNADRESLVSSIKELIESYKLTCENIGLREVREDLQKLIEGE